MNFTTISKKQILMLIAAVIIAAAIPLTVFVSQKQQEIRQRAATPATPPSFALYFTMAGQLSALKSGFTLNPNQKYSFDLHLSPEGLTPIDGFDVTVKFDPSLTISKVAYGTEANSKFDQPLIDAGSAVNSDNSVHLSMVTTKTDVNLTGSLNIATISFTTGSSLVSGKITFLKDIISVTSPEYAVGYLTLSSPIDLSYSIIPAPPPPPPTFAPGAPTPGALVGKFIILHFNGVTLSGIAPSVSSNQLKLTFFDGTTTQQVAGPISVPVARQAGQATTTTTDIPFTPNLPTGDFTIPADTLRLPTVPGDYFIQIRADSYQVKMVGLNGSRTNTEIETQGLSGLTPLRIFYSPSVSNIPGIRLAPGDIDNNGEVDLSDYNNILRPCFGNRYDKYLQDKNAQGSCSDAIRRYTPTNGSPPNPDIDGNGKVDGVDINLLIRSMNGIY